jgi:hypothetical protein
VAQYQRSPKFDASVIWNEHPGLPVLLSLLAHFATGYLVPYAQGPPLLPRDTYYNAHSLNHIPHMVHRESSRNRSDRTPTFHTARIKARLGNGDQFHVMHRQQGDACHERTGLRLPRSHPIGRAVPATVCNSSDCIACVFGWDPRQFVIAGNLRDGHLVTHRTFGQFLE